MLCAVQLVKGDIQSMDLLSFVLQTEGIDTIMHFAAQVWGSWEGQACTTCRGGVSCTGGCAHMGRRAGKQVLSAVAVCL